jgi:hypothetical protein
VIAFSPEPKATVIFPFFVRSNQVPQIDEGSPNSLEQLSGSLDCVVAGREQCFSPKAPEGKPPMMKEKPERTIVVGCGIRSARDDSFGLLIAEELRKSLTWNVKSQPTRRFLGRCGLESFPGPLW